MPIIQEPPRPNATTAIPSTLHPARHAETADTRMGIRHDEEKQEPKKDEHQQNELTLPEDVYDQTTLGIRALIDFLKTFLRTLETPTSTPAPPLSPPTSETPMSQAGDLTPAGSTTNPRAAAAAQAYGRTEQKTRTDYAGGLGGPGVHPPTALLSSTEIRQIHHLIEKLEKLDSQNVVGLKLEKAESFIQSLMNAADAALTPSPSATP